VNCTKEDDFRQLVVSIEAVPAFSAASASCEDHGERGLVVRWRDRRERAFDDIRNRCAGSRRSPVRSQRRQIGFCFEAAGGFIGGCKIGRDAHLIHM
jgi:hypothetical protein